MSTFIMDINENIRNSSMLSCIIRSVRASDAIFSKIEYYKRIYRSYMSKVRILDSSPRISVVMAIYKEPVEWIKFSIDSILNQSFNDFEFIIINDNPSRVENRDILEEYSAKDSRILVIENETNIGLTKSLNKGLCIARGEFIARMDADDISMPERLEKQFEFLRHNLDVGAVGCNAFVINETSDIVSKINRPSDKNVLRYLSIFESPIYHPASFFRRVISNDAVCYNENIKYSQDYALWVSLLNKCNIANIEERLLKYRITESQISNAHHIEQQRFAFENQMAAISNMGIMMNDEDIECFKYLTRPAAAKNIIDNEIVRNFIVKFLKQNKAILSIGYNIVRKRLILIYANAITDIYTFSQALYYLLTLQIATRTFSIYSILSLINKYRIKLVNK